jgi:Ca-activated chloride channel family protein
VVSNFIARRQGDRVGLILFGTHAYLQAPLTFDLASVERLLQEAPIGIAGGKTGIGDAIGLAVKRLRERPEGERVLVLLTDGANNVGEVTPEKAAELAAVERIRIHTIGFGAEAMRMPSLFGVFSSGIVNPSAEIDESTLQAVADVTGGRYFRAQSTEQLLEIYDLIDTMEPIEQDAETYRPIASLYHWPLGAAWLLALGLLALDQRSRHA